MNILAVADHVDALVYSLNIRERFRNIDMVLGAGDLDISYYEYIISTLNKPLYFVFGNHNLKNLAIFKPSSMPDYTSTNLLPPSATEGLGSVCVDGKILRDKKHDIIIAGLGGCRRYNRGEHQFSEFQMFLRVLRITPRLLLNRIFHKRWLDILLTHAPPEGIHDLDDPCHRGFRVFVWFMQWFKPKYLVHGHVHLYNRNDERCTVYNKTTVLNAYDHIVIDRETGMKNSAYIANQAEQDFSKARQKAWIESLRSVVNPEAGQLLSFHDIKSILKPGKEAYLGMKTVDIDRIVGSEDRYQDFSRHFFPKREHLRQRWMSIDRAHLTDVILPPIKLLKIGEIYFVRDGNHRVSVALTQGVRAIDAEVVELTAQVDVGKEATREDILKAVLSFERNNVLNQTGLGDIIPVETIEFTSPGRWHELLNHIEGHKYFMNLEKEEEIPFEEAAQSWYNSLYLPVVEIIRKENFLSRFPRRTEGDLYMWMIKHWHSLKEQYGQEYPLDKAAAEYAAAHGKGLASRMKKRISGIFQSSR